jgi:DNA topoisomerase VI subunit B
MVRTSAPAHKTYQTKPTLQRVTFHTSRQLDYLTEKALATQTGHSKAQWPLVVLKECLDNGLDACEEAGVAPVITATVDEDGIEVRDNGPGIPAETVLSLPDYSERASSREGYVAPDRGRQGNALKTLLAMPFVLEGKEGKVSVASHGTRHVITLTVNPLSQKPQAKPEQFPDDTGQTGTAVRVHWPPSARDLLTQAEGKFLRLAQDFTFVNPHLSLTVTWHGHTTHIPATRTDWPKWRPNDPTCIHWYGQGHFERLVTGLVIHDRGRGVRRKVSDIIAMFRGFSGSQKRAEVLAETGLARADLSVLVKPDDTLDTPLISKLLAAMKVRARPAKARDLGVIGKDHLARRFEELGCDMDKFIYPRPCLVEGDGGEPPYVAEAAFAPCPRERARRLITGVNWSPGIGNPFKTLCLPEVTLEALLQEQRAAWYAPVVVFLHVATPRPQFANYGKSELLLVAAEAYGRGSDGEDDEEAA